MINSLINFLLKFNLFYDLQQTKRQMLKEFREDLLNEKSSQNPITVRTYEDLTEVDKAIINRFKNCYRENDNAVYLGIKLGYSPDGIKRRIKCIGDKIKLNIIAMGKSVQIR